MSHGGNVWQGTDPHIWQDHSANVRPGGAPEWVRHAMLRAMDNVSFYPEPDGKRAAKGIAEYLGLQEDMVIATAGGISAIDMAAGYECSGMLMLTPCFTDYVRQSQIHGCQIRYASILTKDRGFDLSKAYASLFEGCGVWVCNPMNPSGTGFERRAILELLEKVCEVNGRLFIDEAFIDYCRNLSSVELIGEYENVVIVGSLTKSLGIPGVRLGYICGRAEELEHVRKFRRPWEINCFAEAVAMELPAHVAEIEEDAIANAERREHFANGLRALGTEVYDSRADFLLCDMNADAADIAAKLHEKGILVRECMDYDTICDGRHLRIAVKTDEENNRFLEEIGRILKCAGNH